MTRSSEYRFTAGYGHLLAEVVSTALLQAMDLFIYCRLWTISFTAGYGPFHTHFKVQAVLIIEDPTVTVKCRTAIKVMFLYINSCLSIMIDRLSCSFTSISFLTNSLIILLIPSQFS